MRVSVGFLLLVLAACGGADAVRPGAGENPYGIAARGPGVFSVLPLDSSTLVAATPLGALAPPGHVLPTDHVYLYFVDPWSGSQQNNDCRARPIRAAGSGVIDFVLQTESSGDLKVEVQMTRTFWYYYDHVLLKSGIGVGTRVGAGDTIGTTTGRCPSIDLGVIDTDVQPAGLVAPERYGRSAHVASPYRYFTEPLRAWLYGRVRLFDGVPLDKDGRTDFGVKGRLSGDWFHASIGAADASVVNGPQGWPKTLSFAYDWVDGTPRLSVGGTISEAGVLKLASTDPDPRTVSVAQGVVVYAGAYTGLGRLQSSWVVAQLLSDTRLRIEVVPATLAKPTGFTAAAQEYVR